MSFLANPDDVDAAISALGSAGVKVPEGLARLHLAALVDAALHPHRPKAFPTVGQLADLWAWPKSTTYRLLCAWRSWCPPAHAPDFAETAARWGGGTIVERQRNDGGTTAERRRNDWTASNADKPTAAERRRNDGGTTAERRRNESGPARGSKTNSNSNSNSNGEEEAPPEGGLACLPGMDEVDTPPPPVDVPVAAVDPPDPPVVAVEPAVRKDPTAEAWAAYRELHPLSGPQPPKGWEVGARVKDAGTSAVIAVIRWAHESRSWRAAKLREGGFTGKTLFRPGNFAEYRELAVREGFDVELASLPARSAAPAAPEPSAEERAAAAVAWSSWLAGVEIEVDDPEILHVYARSCTPMVVDDRGGITVQVAVPEHARTLDDRYGHCRVPCGDVAVHVHAWVVRDERPPPGREAPWRRGSTGQARTAQLDHAHPTHQELIAC